jgi:hypothetical protein
LYCMSFLALVLYVFLRLMASDHYFDIFHYFLCITDDRRMKVIPEMRRYLRF